MMEELLTAEEVSRRVGISQQTLSLWYKFKRENPDNEYSLRLPEYTRQGSKKRRYWNEDAINELIEFKASIKTGRNGFMGKTTQKYVTQKPDRSENSDKNYINKIVTIMDVNSVDQETIDWIKDILTDEYKRRKYKL